MTEIYLQSKHCEELIIKNIRPRYDSIESDEAIFFSTVIDVVEGRTINIICDIVVKQIESDLYDLDSFELKRIYVTEASYFHQEPNGFVMVEEERFLNKIKESVRTGNYDYELVYKFFDILQTKGETKHEIKTN